jgi:hypothetical protein
MSALLLDGLAEARRIDDLLDDVVAEAFEEKPVAIVPTNRQPLGGLPIGQILRNVNWTNRPRYDWPARIDAEPDAPPADENAWERFATPVGALGLRAFLNTCHWTNDGVAPTRPTFAAVGVAPKPVPIATVESVLGGFAWD